MAYWLLKTEPGTYSWDDLVRDGRTAWDGVRNFMARNNLAAMKVGDEAFLYHSVGPRDVVGVVEIVKEAYPDATAEDPRWVCVDIVPREPLPRAISLDEIKAHPQLAEMKFVKMSRLSVSPLTKAQWDELQRVASLPPPLPVAAPKKKKAPAKKKKAPAKKKKAPAKKAPARAARRA